MLHSFTAENIYSIGEKQTLSFETNNLSDNSTIKTKFGYVNAINCIMGNNGSGKTSILKAITFFNWLIEDSYDKSKVGEPIPFEQHLLYKNKPTKLSVEFDKNDKMFKLEFTLNRKMILQEKLSIKKKDDRKYKKVYSAARNNQNFSTLYSEYLEPLNKREREKIKYKENSPIFSYLLNTGALVHLGIDTVFPFIYTNLNYRGRTEKPLMYDCIEISETIKHNESYKKELLETIRSFDVGIKDIVKSESGKYVIQDENNNTIADNNMMSFVHGDTKNSFELPLPFESDGTIRSITLLFPIMQLVMEGGLLIIDEIETSKHPIIIKKLISSLENMLGQTNNAQIIFSTHQPLLLEDRNKSQIFLTEKTDYINTEVYRLDSVQNVRNNENFAVKYLSGRYGATPRSEVEIAFE